MREREEFYFNLNISFQVSFHGSESLISPAFFVYFSFFLSLKKRKVKLSMRIIRIVARGGEFYFNFNISIETIQIFESFRSEREKSRKFRRKFETLPSNTDLNNGHTREEIGT